MKSSSVEGINCEKAKTQSRVEHSILSLFDTCRKSAPKPPKKEYLRCKLIRGHKRAIRQILSNIIPKTTIHKFAPTDVKAHNLWTLMIKIINKDCGLLSRISKTEEGPITDGRAKRSAESLALSEKSFNAAFCKAYFANSNVRESFFQYINLIFVDFEPKILCKKFDFSCCRKSMHSVECIEKWGELYRYITQDMIEELACEPFVTYHQYIKLPDFRDLVNFQPDQFIETLPKIFAQTEEVAERHIYPIEA